MSMAKNQVVIIDGIEFSMESGTPFFFDGIFSQKKLPGIKLNFTVYGSKDEKKVDDLIRKETVEVEDPFAGCAYTASVQMKKNSFQVGKEGKSYGIEVKQVDELPPFNRIELDGIKFRVLQYNESLTSDKVVRNALLELSKEEIQEFRKLIGQPSVELRRIGIDEVPLKLEFGGRMYWSHHTDDQKEYFKQIVTLLPLNLEPLRLDIASGSIQNAMAKMIVSLEARFELLTKELVANNAISDEFQSALLSSGWKDMISKKKLNQLWESLEQVDDAEKDF